MAHGPILHRRGGKTLLLTAVLACLAWGAESFSPGLYDVTTETGMPHLEEGLRYAVTHEARCLAYQDFPTAFPVLKHPSLGGCRLGQEKREADRVTYVLACDGGHGTTGSAAWELGEDRITGTLHVKLGGKNMTFYQRLIATPRGKCAPSRG